jgi:dTDP-4-amino-4,6-dideoxy-D-galactose acyltransferase
MQTKETCEFLPWDTEFFGRRIAQVVGHQLDRQRVEAILTWCEEHAIECVYFCADSDHGETIRLAEDHGFCLVDIRVTLQRDIKAGPQERLQKSPSEKAGVRYSHEHDIPALQEIARTSHTDSRFYFDPCFPKKASDALYETWIKRSCEGYADIVLVAEMNGQAVGYSACHLIKDTSRGRIGLLGVASQARGLSIGRMLVDSSMEWFAENGVKLVTVSTQGRNIAAQRLYQQCGFLTHATQLWYHKWMRNCTPRTSP